MKHVPRQVGCRYRSEVGADTAAKHKVRACSALRHHCAQIRCLGRSPWQALASMTIQSDWDRVEIAREHIGLTQRQFAVALGVSTTALAAWIDGIPSARHSMIAKVLGVSIEWISTGRNPPPWYVVRVMTTGRGHVDWAAIPSSEVLTAWWEMIEGALLERLQKPQCRLTIPVHVRVRRWRFAMTRRVTYSSLKSVDISLFSQLDPRQLEVIACELGVWPKDAVLAGIVRSGLLITPFRLTGPSSEDPEQWQGVVRQLVDCARRYRKARADRPRQVECQVGVWKLLTEQQVDEPLLAGRAIIPVLGACVRAARTTEILFAMRSSLETAVQMALLGDFCGRKFTLRDMGRYLEQHRGLRMEASRNGQQRAEFNDVISEDTVLRLLKKIATAGELPLTLVRSARVSSVSGRTWCMGNPHAVGPRSVVEGRLAKQDALPKP